MPMTPDQLIHKYSPIGQWQLVDVVFPAAPDTEISIRHTLTPQQPRDIHYTVVRNCTGGTVYESQALNRKEWGTNFIVLCADNTSWKGRLLLWVPKTQQPFNPLEIT